MNEIDILENQAVDAAVNLSWKDAISLNEKILRLDSRNLAACLRLGFANLQINKIKDAKRYYQKALRVQPKNQVALENLERIKVLGEKGLRKASAESTRLDPNLFLEVPGKTKSIALVNLGQKKEIAELAVGQEVQLKLKKRKVEARTRSGKYVGSLPDDLSKRLILFLKAKSVYVSHIKEASLGRVVIFIKEVVKGKRVSHHLSFPQNSNSGVIKMSEEAQGDQEEEVSTEEDEWSNMIEHELTPQEKEEIVDIHSDDEEGEE